MIRLAFCDDETEQLNTLGTLLDQYQKEHDLEIVCRAFQNPLDLLAEIERGVCFDILFLDVLMPGETGMDAAAEIREFDSNVKIIFMTSSSEFAVQSYAVGAYYYQLKPISKESLFHLMDSVLMTCEKEKEDSIILRCKNGITKVKLSRLEYCEVRHHTLFIHLTDGTVLESVGSLDELYKKLEAYGHFLRPHRSYIVNMEHIKNLTFRGITMLCLADIPIPRGKYNEMKDIYLEYIFQSRKVMA